VLRSIVKIRISVLRSIANIRIGVLQSIANISSSTTRGRQRANAVVRQQVTCWGGGQTCSAASGLYTDPVDGPQVARGGAGEVEEVVDRRPRLERQQVTCWGGGQTCSAASGLYTDPVDGPQVEMVAELGNKLQRLLNV
jgi:hypothetical protein